MNIEENSGDKASRKEKRERTKSRIEGDQVGFSEVLERIIFALIRSKLREAVGRVRTCFPEITTPSWLTGNM